MFKWFKKKWQKPKPKPESEDSKFENIQITKKSPGNKKGK